MNFQELADLLQNEKTRLLQATKFIIAFYEQIFNSIVSLRDSLLNHAFPTDTEWKNQLSVKNTTLHFQEFQLISTEGRIQNNSDFIISVLNNLQAIRNTYLPNLEQAKLSEIEKIIAVNKYTWEFIKRLFQKENLTFISGQRLEVANSIKTSIKDRLDNNIGPFFNYLEQIVKDEFRILLRQELKRIVGVYNNYIADPFRFDKMIKQKCTELQVEYNQELILGIIADLSKDQYAYFDQIRSKYQNEEVIDQKKNVYRLKEIAARFIAQTGNVSKLETFVQTIHALFQPVSLVTRVINFLRKMVTGREPKMQRKDFNFHYSSAHGKLEPKHASITALIKEIELFRSFLIKFRNNLDFYSFTKNSSQATHKKLENSIDNCVTDLSKIYEQCIGLREWLIGHKNQKNLAKLPPAKQEEFNDVLLAVNYTLIINKQYLRDMEKQLK